jgi:hypothetical protein
MNDTRSALRVSHHLIVRLIGLIAEAGFNEDVRKAAHKDLDIIVYVDSVDAQRMATQVGLVASSIDPDVLIHRRSSKPAGHDWVEYYVRLRYEGIRDAPDKLGRFMEMVKAVLLLVAQRSKVEIGAIDRWGTITATMREEVARDNSMRFDRDEPDGTVIV